MGRNIAKEINGKFYEFKTRDVGIIELQHVARKMEQLSRKQDRTGKMIDNLTSRLDNLPDEPIDLDEQVEEYDRLENKIEEFEDRLQQVDTKLITLLNDHIKDFCISISIENNQIDRDEWETAIPVMVKVEIINLLAQAQGMSEDDLENFTNT